MSLISGDKSKLHDLCNSNLVYFLDKDGKKLFIHHFHNKRMFEHTALAISHT